MIRELYVHFLKVNTHPFSWPVHGKVLFSLPELCEKTRFSMLPVLQEDKEEVKEEVTFQHIAN